MLEFTAYTKIFISLFAIIDPVGIIPLIIAFTAGMSDQRRERVGRIASVTMFGILIAALLLGEAILSFFGISIHSFRTAGGILLLLMAVNMLIGHKAPPTPEENNDTDSTQSIAIVPLSTPLLAGPGAISAVIVDAHKADSAGHYGMMSLVLVALGLTVWLTFLAAPWVSQRLGKIGSTIVTRLMGLLLAAIAVEFIAGGLRGLFPSLG
ncbi:MAG: NAAT family transporter [Gammaproteobacteria bacterium]|nr:NAAT family transporter [Sideroxydans sp.]MBU3904216.1 NAAT family transporter [Gammaproteobacteria bacterium]MBU4045895.1 NAAT family transporter [Gammaproteobacteria bacterium]MBU4150259.1 NAAT family transporter [Gammaproteobacteria bacterium]